MPGELRGQGLRVQEVGAVAAAPSRSPLSPGLDSAPQGWNWAVGVWTPVGWLTLGQGKKDI